MAPGLPKRFRAEFVCVGDKVEVIGMCMQLEAEAAAIVDPAEMLDSLPLLRPLELRQAA